MIITWKTVQDVDRDYRKRVGIKKTRSSSPVTNFYLTYKNYITTTKHLVLLNKWYRYIKRKKDE